MVSDPAGLLTLTAGPLALTLCPGTGGSIARFDYVECDRRTPILRGCEGVPDTVLDCASFPLVPYVNRIAGGAFAFRGRTITLTPNMPGDPSPLHGQGWLGPWTTVHRGANEATLEFDHQPGEWPWAYRARQFFTLTPDSLEISLSCTNVSDGPMPCGLGQHPYFPCTADTRMRTSVANVWTIDDKVLPVERIPATGRFDISDGPVCGRGLDHGFDGWGGRADLHDPAWPFDLGLSSPDAGFFQLYSPEQGGIFVAEPVTHANAALNADEGRWGELGMNVLAPGEQMTSAMRLSVAKKSA